MKNKLVILGAGESGIGAAILGKSKGYNVFVSDFGEIKPKYKQILEQYQIVFEEKKHSSEEILCATEVIKSPGIPDKAPIIQQIINKNIPIISEIEFAGRYTNAKKICITGSNGKTTTTLWIYHIFKSAGLNVGLAGNIGKSFAWQVAENNFDYYIIELSSFQLDNMYNFKADIAILLNITPDHLDRYNYEFQNYVNSKFRIIQNQSSSDVFIYCADDEVILKEIESRKIPSRCFPFSVKKNLQQGACLEENYIKIKTNNDEFTMFLDELALQGKHNAYNSMAAGISAKVNDITNENIRECFRNFEGVEHRMEYFIKIKGVQYINDSKATNVNSVWYALDSLRTNNIILILGGQDKGNDYSELFDLVKNKVKAIICLGKDNSKIQKAFDGMLEIYDTHSMEDAVRTAYFIANDGEIVLLSPACASFDLFENYEDRGSKFKESVRNL